MKTQANGKRFELFKEWDVTHNLEYDYERYGITNRILSKPIAKSQNPILKIILDFYNASIVYMLKSIDILKNFKNIHWRNR